MAAQRVLNEDSLIAQCHGENQGTSDMSSINIRSIGILPDDIIDENCQQDGLASTVEDEQLVEAVQAYRCIWDTSSRSYKELPKKQEAWKQISLKLGQNEELLKKKWKNPCDGFLKCIKKIDAMTRSGAGTRKLPTCKCFGQLHFIRDNISNRSTQSNMVMAPNSASSSPLSTESSSTSVLEPMSPIDSFQSPPQYSNQLKRKNVSSHEQHQRKKADHKEAIDMLLVKALSNDISSASEKASTDKEENDPDALFCRSLIPTLQSLPKKKNRLCKSEIQKILPQYEFDEAEQC